jgi:ABC-type phosphate transport system permease subunit
MIYIPSIILGIYGFTILSSDLFSVIAFFETLTFSNPFLRKAEKRFDGYVCVLLGKISVKIDVLY